ncbi:MAG: hypothetical protein NTW13_00410 [Candidatus Omnitrophica bacterium]|nr:hypothetical protein [Candidatus Omnitrophota bacterium]
MARENRKLKEEWQKNHRRYFKIADITIQVESDLLINEQTFHSKFKQFEVNGPGADNIFIWHHFSLVGSYDKDLGKEVYRKPPWAIYKNNGFWIYLGISPAKDDKSLHRVVTFNSKHTRAEIFNDKVRERTFLKGDLHSLTMFPSDQILLARVLADKEGCYLHSCGVNFNGKGLLFVGHSEAGKSTMASLLKGKAEILCDDRIIVRKTKTTNYSATLRTAFDCRKPQTEFRIYGTWSHGDVPDVSSNSAPLKAVMFLKKAEENMIIPIIDKKEIIKRLLPCLIKPFVTADWWEKTLALIEKLAKQVPCYVLEFDKTGAVVDILRKL